MNIYSRKLLAVLLMAFLVSVAAFSYGQPKDTTESPTVGLVLSGGAAKGLAHVGVLKVLEEAGIQPDYITGTSMGAIVGGLYALGYSASDLMELTQKTDWDRILTDRVPLNKIVMEEKHDYKRFMVEFPIRNYEFKFPAGLNEGYQLERLFSELTWGATGIHDFDSLAVPFRCKAVDIIEGRPVTFKTGHLSRALRASMAIPGFFAPVRMDSMLLVDGGVMRNFPVEEAREMGADTVIGVYVGFEDDVTPEDLFSFTDVLTRTTVMSGVLDSRRQMEKADILITPNMEGIQAYDFSKGLKIASRGEEAAMKILPRIERLAEKTGRVDSLPQKLTGPEYLYVSDVGVENLRYVDTSFVIGKGRIFPGTYTTREKLDQAVQRIFSTRYFKRVNYRLEKQGKNIYRLVYVVKETTRAQVKGALHYDNHFGTGLILNGTLRNYLIPASRVNLTVNMAEKPGVKFDLYKYYGRQQRLMDHYFVDWYRSELPVFYNENQVGKYRHGMFKAGLGGRYSLGINQQIGVKAFYEKSTIYPDQALQAFYPEVNFENYGFGGIALRAYYRLNNQDDLYFPTRGTRLEASVKRVFEPITKYQIDGDQTLDEEIFSLNLDPFYTFHLNADHYFRASPHLSIKLGASAGLASPGTPVTNNYALGGVIYDDKVHYETMAGYDFGEMVVPNFFKVNAGLDVRLTSRVFLTFHANAAHTAEKPDLLYDKLTGQDWNDVMAGYAAGVRFKSILGPVVLMVGDNRHDARTRFYLNLGYTF